jgi:alanyl-tRNA synthetase
MHTPCAWDAPYIYICIYGVHPPCDTPCVHRAHAVTRHARATQVADTGTITTASGASFAVHDVKKFGAYVLHVGVVTKGTLKVGDEATLAVDYARRAPIAKNHTSTHMLNLAIKGALGVACDQRGSLCDVDKMRFDFAYGTPPHTPSHTLAPHPRTPSHTLAHPRTPSHTLAPHPRTTPSHTLTPLHPPTDTLASPHPFTPPHPPSPGKPMTVKQLQDTQERVNAQIAAGLPVNVEISVLSEAQTINGLRAVFGEQYPDPVRVVAVGGPGIRPMIDAPTTDEWSQYSTEFCGGTHVANTAEIKSYALITEEGLGKGVRRVLGVTGEKAEAAFADAAVLREQVEAAKALDGEKLAAESAELLKRLEAATIPAVDTAALRDAIMALKAKVVAASKGGAKAVAAAAIAEAEALVGAAASPTAPVVALLAAEADAKALEAAVKVVTAKLPEAPVLLMAAGKTLAALAVVPKALEGKLPAGEWLNTALACCGGKGGGKAGRANGNARDPANAAAALVAAKEFASSKLGVDLA